MLTMSNQNISMDAQSTVNGVTIATMNANVNGTEMGGAYFNVSVMDMDAFIANKTSVMSDFSTFCDKVTELVTDIANGPDKADAE